MTFRPNSLTAHLINSQSPGDARRPRAGRYRHSTLFGSGLLLALVFLQLLSSPGTRPSSKTSPSSDERPSLAASSEAMLAAPLRGVVRLARASSQEGFCGARLEPWAPLWQGDRLCLETGAAACLLCPDGSVQRLDASHTVGPALCDSPPQTSCHQPLLRTSDPLAGHERIADSLTTDEMLELETALGITLELRGRVRGQDEVWGHDPVLVSPRCLGDGKQPLVCERWLSEPREILFLEVEDADAYYFELAGLRNDELAWISSEYVVCESSPSFGETKICAIPWPQEWSLPEDGRSVQLSLSARVGSQLRLTGNPTTLSRIPRTERQRLLETLPVTERALETSAETWWQRTYQQWGLIAELHASLIGRTSHTAASQLMLAKTCFLTGTPRPARYHLERLSLGSPLQSGASEAIRAGAEIGLAWVALALDQPAAARLHGERAALIYRRSSNASGLAEVARLTAALPEIPEVL